MSKQQLQSLRQEAISLISKMSDDQCAVVMEAFKLSVEDSSKTEEECIKIAAERLGIPIHLHSEVSE